MKDVKSNFWIYAIVFMFGVLISYICCQYKILDIDKKINVTETTLALMTAFVGLHIAVSLQKRQSRSQNIYSNLEKKLDSLWEQYSQFSAQLEGTTSIGLNDVNISTKKFNQKIATFKIMLVAFNLRIHLTDTIEHQIDALENELTSNSNITNNIIDYSANKSTVLLAVERVHYAFANNFKELNQMV